MENLLKRSEHILETDRAEEEDLEDSSTCVDGVITVGRVMVILLERELWTQFSKLGTEMIITKAGRWVAIFTQQHRASCSKLEKTV